MGPLLDVFDKEYIARMYELDLLNQGREEGRQEGEKKGRQEGLLEGVEKSLRNLISATGWTLEQAMTSLGIPEEERPIYREILKNVNA